MVWSQQKHLFVTLFAAFFCSFICEVLPAKQQQHNSECTLESGCKTLEKPQIINGPTLSSTTTANSIAATTVVIAAVNSSNANCYYYDCSTCVAQSNCGWCASNVYEGDGSCSSGGSSGPISGTCPASRWNYYSCPCNSYGTCSQCVAKSNCGWCKSTSKCYDGSAYGPSSGVCYDWQFSTCSQPSSCSYYYSCESCTSHSGCGMCGDVCMSGYSYGPWQPQFCYSDWKYYSSDCNNGNLFFYSSSYVLLLVGGVVVCSLVSFLMLVAFVLYKRRNARSPLAAQETRLLSVNNPPEVVDAPDIETCLICTDSKVSVFCHVAIHIVTDV